MRSLTDITKSFTSISEDCNIIEKMDIGIAVGILDETPFLLVGLHAENMDNLNGHLGVL